MKPEVKMNCVTENELSLVSLVKMNCVIENESSLVSLVVLPKARFLISKKLFMMNWKILQSSIVS